MDIWHSCVVAPDARSRWIVRGKPGTTTMDSAARLTMPSSNVPRDLASTTSPSCVSTKYPKSSACCRTGRPSRRLRNMATLPSNFLASSQPPPWPCRNALLTVPTPTEASAPRAKTAKRWKSPPGTLTLGMGSVRPRRSLYMRLSARDPWLVSMSNALRSTPAPSARRSPLSSAPRDCSRFAAADANRRSPPHGVTRMRYSGAEDWLLRCERPNC
mmetsp:Transcript_31322/g.78484  ORF Transcript_31322/g.78484 Transcript_31322/m.78484 type:complete len:215 (+) Transcript_31322:677-1321(+)